MCLFTRKSYSKYSEARKYDPYIASHPILVSKYLDKYLQSPYQGFKFTIGKLFKTKLAKGSVYNSVDNFKKKISKGFHSFYSENGTRSLFDQRYILFPAIIPAKSSFFIGSDLDIVSDRLIVFSTMVEINRYLAENNFDFYVKIGV